VAPWLSYTGGPDRAEMQAILASLPLDAWMTVQTTPLTPHPGEPGLAAS
jgi:muconolactone delta-isomerase